MLTFTFADVKNEYEKNKDLKKDDVEALMDWVNKQPHLPQINELQAILFLHSCYYKNEAAKTTIDNFFTHKTNCPEMFKNRNQLLSMLMDICLVTILPKETPEGYTVVLLTFLDRNADNFTYPSTVKFFDMVTMSHLYQKGTSNGFLIVIDFERITFTHVAKSGPLNIKKFFFYLQEALPVRLMGLHFYHIVPFMDKVLALIKPFMKKEVQEKLCLHDTVESLTKFIPLECLPQEYGGPEKSIPLFHKEIKEKLGSNTEFFEWEESLKVDENKREGRSKNLDEFGVEGTFKKLELD